MRRAIPLLLAILILEPVQNSWQIVKLKDGSETTILAAFCVKELGGHILSCYYNIDGISARHAGSWTASEVVSITPTPSPNEPQKQKGETHDN